MYLKYYPFVPFFTMPGPVSFCRPFFVPLATQSYYKKVKCGKI